MFLLFLKYSTSNNAALTKSGLGSLEVIENGIILPL